MSEISMSSNYKYVNLYRATLKEIEDLIDEIRKLASICNGLGSINTEAAYLEFLANIELQACNIREKLAIDYSEKINAMQTKILETEQELYNRVN